MQPLPPLDEACRRERNALARRAAQRSMLGPDSVHGPAHWARVERHARELCAVLGVDPRIPVLFAVLHDSCRLDDGIDPGHGARAAAWMRELVAQGILMLDAQDADRLAHAMDHHTHGIQDGPLVEQICWDADRLDLGRVGITPDPARLCTAPAREAWRIARAVAWSNGKTLRTRECLALACGGEACRCQGDAAVAARRTRGPGNGS